MTDHELQHATVIFHYYNNNMYEINFLLIKIKLHFKMVSEQTN